MYWAMVFPLGMYTACTSRLAEAMDYEFLQWIPRYFIYPALTACLVTFVVLLNILIGGNK